MSAEKRVLLARAHALLLCEEDLVEGERLDSSLRAVRASFA